MNWTDLDERWSLFTTLRQVQLSCFWCVWTVFWVKLKRPRASHMKLKASSDYSLKGLTYLICLSSRGLLQVFPPDSVPSLQAPFDSATLSRFATDDWGGLTESLNKDFCFQLYCHHRWQHLACERCRANGKVDRGIWRWKKGDAIPTKWGKIHAE